MPFEKEKTKNVEVELNIDDNCEMLKKIYYLGIGKKIDEVMDINRTCVKMSKVSMKGAEILNVSRHMLRTM